MITDILIGIIIGVGLERALRVSHLAQKIIKQAKEAKKKEQYRKQKILHDEICIGKECNKLEFHKV